MSDPTATPAPDGFNLAHHVLWRNDAPGDKIALAVLTASGAERFSYDRLRASVLTAAAGLLDAGLMPGNRLVLALGNTSTFPVAFLAAIAADILPVPVPSGLTPDETAQLAQALDPAAVLTAGTGAVWPGIRHLTPDILTGSSPLDRPRTGDANRPAYLMVTSGTTGRPRLVTHAHRAILGRIPMRAGWTGLGPTDRMLHAGAFNWSYTLGTGLLDPWSVGATALVPAQNTDPALIALLAKRHDATILAAVPGVYRRLLAGPLPPLPRLRHALSAGEALAPSLRARWQEVTGTDIHEAFGQTECSTFLSGSPDAPAPSGTLGRAQPGRRVAILDDSGAPLPPDTMGQIAVSTDDPGLALLVDGAPPAGDWWGTGDMGTMSADGWVTYLGRADDILTAGGYRLSPTEIEAPFTAHPDITAAAAVDHRLGPETVIVALHYSADEPLADAELQALAARHLAPHKRPRLFIHAQTLPRGANGKLLRRALRAATDPAS
ncbi:AMP-binding protein [Alphaproteobacteria bacterium GH1-50]|uniref:AMP-binding protein n=1 Tax=Kangsaoukella pontilimi TaxID=2691042 RepID=A0A7C9INA2_9RHOB|nr:AMP-binding protein [Kangsaoukella pontilimi]MXQ07230.1 AMP-binding protein [Kangsaoukella pontilimi]